ncbi:MAG TPA: M3 family metallopeptidase [Chthoniobacterales bacterium]|nr:M3 family metallopeptidase [Chthoniobacterales bacterium]
MRHLVLASLLCASLSAGGQDLKSLDHFRAAAEKANSALTLPSWPQTPAEVEQRVDDAIAKANAGLDTIGKLEPGKVTFKNTIVALDDIGYEAGLAANVASLIKETNKDAAMRAAGEKAVKTFQEWSVGTDYREDVYKAVKAFAAAKPKLTGEDAKLFEETIRDYKRAGLDLPRNERQEVERMRKELTKLTTDFDSNVVAAKEPVVFTKAELQGVPDSLLNSPGVKTGDDQYTILANVTFQYQGVMQAATREETRKRLHRVRFNLAREKNIPLLNEILATRNRIALALGYKSWNDYKTEVKMAKSGANARKFIADMVAGTEPKFTAEVAGMQKLKAEATGSPNATISRWDWRHYSNEIKKRNYDVDVEALRVYFPYQQTLEGMFNIYQRIFGLKFEQIEAPQKWTDDLQLYYVSDAASGEPMGMFYLDMFPREGKYNHFAQFDIIGGKVLPDGKYQRPTVALICNFPPPADGKPSLLPHSDVETLFHEFGHAMHSILTRANHTRFAGANVPRDFVEAPSQMLQNWVWTKPVLDTFAADYRDPAKKIPAETIEKMKEAKIAVEGTRYRRQFAMADVDLALHDVHPERQPYDALKVSNEIAQRIFLPLDPDTAFAAYFGHLSGYDAGYYGYAWADAIAADMAAVFEKSKEGFLDKQAGMRLRNEVYAVGDSRDVDVSIEKFLGRKRSIEPFLKSLGIGGKKASAGPSNESR